jgi:hypothetical protein
MAVERSGALSMAVASSGVSQFPARVPSRFAADLDDAGGELRGEQRVVGGLGGQLSDGTQVDI